MVMVSPQFDRADRARGGFGGRVAQRFFRHAKFSSTEFCPSPTIISPPRLEARAIP